MTHRGKRVLSTLVLLASAIVLPVAAEEREPAAPAALNLKVYANEIDTAPFGRVNYGYDRDAVCAEGRCDDGTTVCKAHLVCAGIGSGLCNLDQTCTDDFSPNCAPPNDTCGVAVDSVTVGAPPGQSIWELVCNPATPGGDDCQVGFPLPATTVSWDFSGFNLSNFPNAVKVTSTTTDTDASEFEDPATAGQCPFNEAGVVLDRQDKDWTVPANTVHTLGGFLRENDVQVCMGDSGDTNGAICTGDGECGDGSCVTTDTIWIRGVLRFEGLSGPLGEGESRLCYNETAVPLYRFPNQDASGRFLQLGDDRWEHTVFDCEEVVQEPAVSGINACNDFEGKQTGQVVNEGVVLLPSGHKFKAVVLRTAADYCAGSFLGICLGIDQVRTVNYLWVVPHLGTVVRLQSDKIAPDLESYFHLAEADIKYGLFPPRTLDVGTVADTTVDLSWDPGLITDEIDGYRIYWDIESGGQCVVGGEDCNADTPAFGANCPSGKTCCSMLGDTCNSYGSDSDTNPGQVVFNTATSATVTGLAPGTTYYFTVTAKSDFTDPGSLDTESYESVLYPTQIPAMPVDLPIEVQVTTTGGGCTPTLEVSGVTVERAGNDVQICWDASADPCIDGYRILGAATPEAAVNFSIESDTGLVTCDTFDPTGSSFFLVIGRGSGGTGPWGHYGQ